MFQTHLPNKCLFYVAEIRALENHAFAVFHFWSKNAECQPTYVKERTNVFLKRMRAFQNILGLYICLSICPSVFMAFFFHFKYGYKRKSHVIWYLYQKICLLLVVVVVEMFPFSLSPIKGNTLCRIFVRFVFNEWTNERMQTCVNDWTYVCMYACLSVCLRGGCCRTIIIHGKVHEICYISF